MVLPNPHKAEIYDNLSREFLHNEQGSKGLGPISVYAAGHYKSRFSFKRKLQMIWKIQLVRSFPLAKPAKLGHN